ncbi:hypothetical protein Tco_0510665, partial [Tanacetum coccineum]
ILSFFVLPEGCDPLALVDGFTPVEDSIGADLLIVLKATPELVYYTYR